MKKKKPVNPTDENGNIVFICATCCYFKDGFCEYKEEKKKENDFACDYWLF